MTLLAAIATLALAACGGSGSSAPATLVGYAIEPTTSVADLSLPDTVSGEPTSLAAPAGSLRVVYFGFTNCPDICPTTLAAVKAAIGRVTPEHSGRVTATMITVDPDRDSAAGLTQYIRSFDPAWTAMRTDDAAALARVADRFGVSYVVTTDDDGTVEVDHTATTFVVDDDGTIVDYLMAGATPAEIANDLDILLAERPVG